MIKWKLYLELQGHSLQTTIMAFAWRDVQKQQRTSAKVADDLAEIRARNFRNIRPH